MSEDLYQCQTYPILVIISGPSGVGKDTVARRLIKRRPEEFYFVVTATTREPRENEVEGYDYFFVSNDEFALMIEEDALLEYAVVYNQYKGIPKQQVIDALNSGKNVIMRLDVQGTETVRKLIPSAITIFLRTPTEADLVRRLRNRESDPAEGVNLRVVEAIQEMRRMQEFRYCVVNAEDQQELAVDQILSIVDAAHCQVKQEKIEL
jgi:guanylate kinase